MNHVVHNTSTVLGRTWSAVFWVDINLAIKKGLHSIRLDRMQSSFKKHFQLVVFQNLWDWRLETSCMRNHRCLLDHHQRYHYDTITIGPEGKFNWVLHLINSQKVKLFESHEEMFNTQRSHNWPNQSQNQSVIDQDKLRTRKVCLLGKVKRPVPMRSMRKVFTNDFVLQIDQDNLWSRLSWLKFVICLITLVLRKLTMDQGNLMSIKAQQHTVKEQHAHEVHREIPSFNTDNELTREIIKKDIDLTFQDYHIPPWNNWMAPAFETWFRKSRTTRIGTLFKEMYNKVNHSIPSAKNQSKWFMNLGTSNCVNYSIWNPQHSAK